MGIYGFSMIFSYFSGWNDEIPQFLVGWTPTLCGWKIRANHNVWWVHGSRVFFFARDITDIPNLGCYSYLLISWWFVFPMCVAHLLSSWNLLQTGKLCSLFSQLSWCCLIQTWKNTTSHRSKCTRPVIWMVASSSNDNGEISFLLRYCLLNSNAGWSDMLKPG